MGLREFTSVPPDPRDWGRWMRAQFITADSVAPNTITTNMIVDEQVTLAKLADLPGLSVMGRPVSSIGVPTAITAANDGEVLRRSGSSVGFFPLSLAGLTTTNLAEGANLYFTTERAQDAVAAALVDSSSIDFTYTDGSDQITAAVIPGGVNHNALLNYDANQHVDHTGVTLTAGNGLTGGGNIAASRSFEVGAGTGITVNADDVAINQGAALTWTAVQGFNRTFTSITDVAILLSSARPAIIFSETGVAANNGKWGFDCDATNINRSLFTDAGTDAAFEIVTRSGNTCTGIAWSATLCSNTGNFQLTAVGNKHLIKEGSNASMGAATLVAGTVTVNNTLVTANSRIFLTGQNSSGTHGELTISARSAGTSFTITSSLATDTRSVAWLIVEPAP